MWEEQQCLGKYSSFQLNLLRSPRGHVGGVFPIPWPSTGLRAGDREVLGGNNLLPLSLELCALSGEWEWIHPHESKHERQGLKVTREHTTPSLPAGVSLTCTGSSAGRNKRPASLPRDFRHSLHKPLSPGRRHSCWALYAEQMDGSSTGSFCSPFSSWDGWEERRTSQRIFPAVKSFWDVTSCHWALSWHH